MKNMTVLEVLNESLPSKYVLAIIANMNEKVLLDHEAGHVIDEIEEIFNWTESNEGYDFWATLVEAMEEGEKLPELPFRVMWLPNSYISTSVGSFLVNVNGSGHDVLISLDFSSPALTYEAKVFKEKYFSFCN